MLLKRWHHNSMSLEQHLLSHITHAHTHTNGDNHGGTEKIAVHSQSDQNESWSYSTAASLGPYTTWAVCCSATQWLRQLSEQERQREWGGEREKNKNKTKTKQYCEKQQIHSKNTRPEAGEIKRKQKIRLWKMINYLHSKMNTNDKCRWKPTQGRMSSREKHR